MNRPREWFQPKAAGIGWTARNWKGGAIIVFVIAIGTVVGRIDT